MKLLFNAFGKKLFGVKYERLLRTLFIYLLVYEGLHIADFKVQLAPSILYLMITTFTAGVMWQALSSEDNAAYMQNMMMLPFQEREFIFSYVAALGVYTCLTKTAALLTVLLAVSTWNETEILAVFLCSIHAFLVTAAVFSLKKYWYVGGLWSAAVLGAILHFGQQRWFALIIIVNSILAILLLRYADGYIFYLPRHEKKRTLNRRKHQHSVWSYLFRYLFTHKNYLINTVIMYCVACALPLFCAQMEKRFAVPIGFAILSLNTPICILLSCDPALEQAVRFLPGQMKSFCLPYILFIFLCNMTADIIFLGSLQVQIGGVTVHMIATAIFFALLSAICSVFLEWFYPLRRWKIESDLWHHPRKYLVPAAMLLLAGFFGALA